MEKPVGQLDPKIVSVSIGTVPDEVPQPASGKKSSKNKKAASKEETIKDFSTMIQAGSSILAMTVHPCWQMVETETMSIARPLVNIIDRYNLLEKFADVSDGAMLFTALSIITLPRVMTTIQAKQQQNPQAAIVPEGVKINGKSKKPKAATVRPENIGTDRPSEKHTPDGTVTNGDVQTVFIESNSQY